MFAFEGRSPPAAVQLASQITAPNTAAPAPRDQHPSIQPSTSPSTSLSTFQHRPAPSCSGVRDLELQPFLAPRPPNPHEYLDDNKDFVPTAEGDYDEQLFRSSSPRLVPPMPHTRGSPGNRVHAGDFRYAVTQQSVFIFLSVSFWFPLADAVYSATDCCHSTVINHSIITQRFWSLIRSQPTVC